MRVLGISPLDKDVTASFVEDGEVLFACGEERLSRTKLQDGFPQLAIDLGLKRTGWTVDSIDVVAYGFLDGADEESAMRASYQADGSLHAPTATRESTKALGKALKRRRCQQFTSEIPGIAAEEEFLPSKSWWKRGAYRLLSGFPRLDHWMHRRAFRDWIALAAEDHKLRTQQLHDGLDAMGLRDKLQRFHHHKTHAANAYYASGYDEALLISLDGYGTGHCGGVFVGTPEGLELEHLFRFPSSLGQYYEYVTAALGFRPGRHEGKIVGLAAYGDPEILAPALRARFNGLDVGDIQIRGAMNYIFTRMMAGQFAMRDVAAAYQTVLEEVVKTAVEFWVQKTGLRCVAVSGGVNANVKLNQRIHEIDGVDSVFVYPNMGDGGCATGAAWLVEPPNRASGPIKNAYWGPDYSPDEIRAALDEEKLGFEEPENIELSIAQLIADDRIVARFNGRMEYGPRALGNRSILYPAKEPEVNLWLNYQLGRTEFMPFAPACLAEKADEMFVRTTGCEKTSEFMTITFDCTKEMARLCPAAVHVDNTARPQFVSAETNSSFHAILTHYYEITGIPAVINTSFNMHEEPIVCSPQDAVRAFLQGRIDYLAIGDFLVPHPQLSEISKERSSAVCV